MVSQKATGQGKVNTCLSVGSRSDTKEEDPFLPRGAFQRNIKGKEKIMAYTSESESSRERERERES